MCFVWLSEQRVTFALHIINRLVFITEAESVYSAVRTESLCNTYTSRILKVQFVMWTATWLEGTHFTFCR
jgi:hypothetical protein